MHIFQIAQPSPTATVLYLPFNVSGAGTLTLETFGTFHIDPFIRLYSGAAFTGAGLGSELAYNDDPSLICDGEECRYEMTITPTEGVAPALSTATVPEPVTPLLLGTGLLGIGVVRRRRDTEE